MFSVVGIEIEMGDCGSIYPKWRMQCPISESPIWITTMDGVDLTETKKLDVPEDQHSVVLLINAVNPD